MFSKEPRALNADPGSYLIRQVFGMCCLSLTTVMDTAISFTLLKKKLEGVLPAFSYGCCHQRKSTSMRKSRDVHILGKYEKVQGHTHVGYSLSFPISPEPCICLYVHTPFLLSPASQGSFLTQGLNANLLRLLHWQADSLSLCHLGSFCY